MKFSQLLSGALLAGAAQAQVGAYGQCGGYEWTGLTTCVSGYYCMYYSEWYSQCIPGTATTTSTSTIASSTKSTSSTSSSTLTTSMKSTSSTSSSTLITSTIKSSTSTTSTSSSSSVKTKSTTSTSTSATASATGFKWLGVDESGAEFGSGNLPGVWGTDFIFPSTTSISTLVAQGYNIFRVPFLMERMVPTSLTGTFWEAYLANYTAVINDITSLGAWAIVDPHNFGRYKGAIITDTVGFGAFWANLASQYVSNPKVIFDTNNEYNTEDQTLVFNLNQAAITSIRGIGATSQYIFVEGNAWSGAWDWTTVNTNLVNLTDPSNKLIYEMHQYLDSDDSGTSDVCVNNTIGYDRVIAATQWLKTNNKLGIIGEFAGGANSVCLEAVQGMLSYLQENSDVWLGALWWGGGPWWGDYIFAFEPPSSTGYNYYDTMLLAYAP